jgi:hypothetical protein
MHHFVTYFVREMTHSYHSRVTCRAYHQDRDEERIQASRSGYQQSSRESPVAIDEQHVAMPKLYGAPAYARPPAPVDESGKPFDPDDLPIVAYQTDEERLLLESLPARAWAPGGGFSLSSPSESATRPSIDAGRPFVLRALAGRFRGGDS